MGFIEEADVRRVLEDNGMVDEIVKELVSNPAVLDELAEDVADELEDLLEDDPSFRRQIVEAATSNPNFKASVIKKLVEEMSD